MLTDLQDTTGFGNTHLGDFRNLFDRCLPAELLQQILTNRPEFTHRFDHMNRNTNRPGMIGNGPGDRLSNPPSGIGAEFISPTILVFIHGPHQAGITFLNNIEKAQSTITVFLRDRNNQP